MKRVYANLLHEHISNTVTVMGFVHSIRNQGGIKFVILRDISGFVQIVILKTEKEIFEIISSLTLESVIKVQGLVKKENQAPKGVEILANNIEILSKAQPQLPIPVVIEKGASDVDITKRLDFRWIDLRKSDNQKIFRIWTELEKGFRDYFYNNDFIQVYTPTLMSTASESGAEVFKVDYFDKNAFLAQSPQFYKQMAIASDFDKIFTFGPVFRAEPSFTTRHVTEFTGWDFEIGYINSHHDIISHEENLIVNGFKEVSKFYDVKIPTIPFPKMTMHEVKKILLELKIVGEKEHDLSPEEERAISEYVKAKFNHDFLFVTDYHQSVRPFYHMRHNEDSSLTKSFDLLYKGIEITTGAQREHRYDILQAQAIQKGMNLNDLEGYLNFFKYGCPPHGGAGIGPARIIMKMLDLSSVKEAIFLPRDLKRLTP